MTTLTQHPVAADLNRLADELNQWFKEREDLVQASILAILCREHVFALGAPGTSKSYFFRTLARAFSGARYFECALSKTRPAEAVKGPLDIPAFREKGDYRYKRKGFLLDAHLAMLDEIGKASPVLGHDLLAALNERLGHEVDEQGNSTFDIPLSTAFTAANEMLTDDSDDNAAIWDRLLFRVLVEYIQDVDNWKAMLLSDEVAIETRLDWSDMPAAFEQVKATVVTDETLEALAGLKDAFARENLSISDRRWKASIKALRANAFLNGRSETARTDIEVMRFTLWETPQQIEKVERLCKSAANPFYEPVMRLRDELAQVAGALDERKDAPVEQRADFAIEVTQKLRRAVDQLTTIEMEAGDAVPADVTRTRGEIESLMLRNLVEMMEQDREGAEISMRELLYGGSQ